MEQYFRIAEMYMATEAFRNPKVYNYNVSDGKIIASYYGDDDSVFHFQLAYLNRTGEILSDAYMNAIRPALDVRFVKNYDNYQKIYPADKDARIHKQVDDLINICEFQNYSQEKLAIIFDLFDICYKKVPVTEIYSKFNPNMTDQEFVAMVSEIKSLAEKAIAETDSKAKKVKEAIKMFDTLSVGWPDAKTYADNCRAQLENIPTLSNYINSKISKIPNIAKIPKEQKQKEYHK